MDYKELLEKTKSELETLKLEKAKAEERMSTLATELGIDLEGDVESQINTRIQELQKLKSEQEQELNELKSKYDELVSASK